ncbi:prolyl oligopeptidase family serine peptidase [Clostridium bowmanii]|uniref:carboxylesterase family protein n=1 Tax=Clostridium bowmanii TaxID=132925 RepID=UPI001C0E4447|nr:prolyl oligopeptidase family serine peptidase [Clostridium bowmanii]MBU3189382.1 prolyl oligopeptidase family serine peptidase [Clostridium bowmanii]MCA1073996.1 prolyl oligopeptidase family serine peptidase [Clostridium bowmanii]
MMLNKTIKKAIKLEYLLYLPEDYSKETDKKWPLVLFLHGSGERGENVEMVAKHGIPKLAEEKKFPFIALSPQCPTNSNWEMQKDAVLALLHEAFESLSIDKDRVYLTGLSLGGYGTWSLSQQYPELFAAIVPICGGGLPINVSRIKDIPVWAFHGAKDDIVPIDETERMVQALQKINGNVKYTIYSEATHDCWSQAYNEPELYKWLLAQKKIR